MATSGNMQRQQLQEPEISSIVYYVLVRSDSGGSLTDIYPPSDRIGMHITENIQLYIRIVTKEPNVLS